MAAPADVDLPERLNLAADLLDRHLEAGKGWRPALRYRGRTISYAEVAAEANRAGNALRALGVEVEQRVAIALPDSPEFVAAFLGAIKIGAVALPLNTLLRPEEFRHQLADSGAVVLVTDDAIVARVRPIRRELPRLRHVVVAGLPQPDALSYEELTRAAAAELDAEATTKDDMCFWQYSSGTTGAPKAAVHLQHDLYLAARVYGRHVLDLTAEDRAFSVSKLFFSYGLSNSLVLPFTAGACAVLVPERVEPHLVFETIAAERPTLFFAVPTAYAALLNAAGPADLSSVRRCVSAGEALPRPLFERWRERFGRDILDGIGSTEVGYIFISNTPRALRPGTSGRVLPGYEAKLVDVDVEDGVGDLWVKADSTMALYWRQHERTTRTLRGEWIVTGDRYRVDADGYYAYAGRADDMLRVGAQWVSPIEIEAALLEHPSVAECAVAGREDEEGLVRPAAFVVLRSGSRASTALALELREHLEARLPAYKRPRWVEFRSELPKTATGKIQRFKLRG